METISVLTIVSFVFWLIALLVGSVTFNNGESTRNPIVISIALIVIGVIFKFFGWVVTWIGDFILLPFKLFL